MRVIGGSFKGRKLLQPPLDITRPITDRAKEAIFNVLGDISGLTVADLYAGSGSLGIESISRGASHVVAVERDPQAAKIISTNYQKLAIEDKLQLFVQPVAVWLLHNKSSFDLVFYDPPFDTDITQELKNLAHLLTSNGTLVIKHSKHKAQAEIENLRPVKSKRYATSAFTFYKP